MRVSFKWLQEYVDIDVAPEALAESLTLAGLAVEGMEEPGKGIEKVYTGKILKIDAHPNADKLVICQVEVGEGEQTQIVTGATNVREGQVVPVAVVGAKLAGGLTIKKAKLRGVESRGMLCSGDELGLDPDMLPDDQRHGIMILPAGTPVGVDVKPLIGLDDVIMELELTPNRGDCMSMLGVAREVAAILQKPLKLPSADFSTIPPGPEDRVQIDIDDPDLCRRYVARLLKNVKVGPSPVWMQQRLRAAGVRPISNVVDVTNYVMMETGQPMHAFDYHKLKDGHIIVRRAAKGETIISLDKAERKLTPDMLVITDPNGPVAVAGVMGGLDSEVTENTTAVLLESAYFKPVNVRRTSRDLGLRSESSSRFEKGIDITGCLRAADRAAALLAQMGAAEVVDLVVDNYPAPAVDKTVLLRPDRVNRILDTELATDEISTLLTRLQFKVREENDGLLVTVPGHRPDVGIEADLIEEVARLYGYNRVKNTLPTGVITQGGRKHDQRLAINVKNFLAQSGFYEVITYSFVNIRVFDRLGLPEDSHYRSVVSLQNPLSEEQAVMRALLFPGLLEVLQRNSNRRVKDGAVFELGRVFYPRPGETLPEEVPVLAAAVTGVTPGGWNARPVPMDFYYLKGVLEALLAHTGIKDVSFIPATGNNVFHPGRVASVLAGDVELGIIGELHPDVQENYDLDQRVTVMELDFNRLTRVSGAPKQYRPLPKFPGVDRDLAVVVRQDIPARQVIETISQAGGSILQDVRVFDIYRDEHFAPGEHSMAFALKFQAADRTLTDEEVAKKTEAIMQALQRDFGAVLRK
ncbi:phenylalanine--tRNA ligase subunit beta [Desulfallas thermosapovorans]|uniref:Phenylalanine--tRNA ligase beta subunit n=1 Tax=Desulfallas thermosapovorans DSM 6562 TaxID=1121431 RepID=A0A5S4ZP76_9FIRM|nr:phenylalanine--tRNA ligase subunit beta [Desulfallas thermosapovorans]TYO94557.1 phenylalanyl-tRNA synthetase beta subunit [Desulfallas thermosapovorans DSM 6562]